MQANEPDARLPLVIGVTGHRKINAADPRLAEAIRAELGGLRRQFPHCPFLMLSGLAEGADRLVARLAMETLATRLIAVLPFAEAEFRKDFTSAESQAEFSELLQRAQAVVVIPQREDVAAVAAGGEARNRQYARVGAYIVENCHWLIALWDGQPARGTGGTGEVVRWRMAGEVPLEYSTAAAVRSALWPKAPARWTHIDPAAGEKLPMRDNPGRDAALQAVEAYNREVEDLTREEGARVIQGLMADPLGARTSDPLVREDAGLRRLLGLLAVADVLAVRNQRRDNKLVFSVALLFFFAMLAFNLTIWKWSMLLYALFLLAIALVAKWARGRRIEERFFDYRALAEGLRVAVFWRLAGLQWRVSQNYLNEHLGVLSWIREGLAGAELASLTTETASLTPTAARVAFVREVWLQDQGDYFDAKVSRLSRQTRLLTRYATAAFFVSWLVAVGKLIGSSGGPGSWLESLTTQLVLFSGPFLAAGLALGFYRQKRALDVIKRRYAMSRELFDRARARLLAGEYPAETVLLQLGREALNENGDWLWTQRDAPLTPRK